MDDDRLSELPDSLILSILSFLDMRDVVTTTLLSKRWKNRWTTVPCLHFGSRYPLVESSKFISGALAQWKGAKILMLNIFFPSDDPLIPSCDIDSWLLFAIEKQVQKLCFGCGYKIHNAYYFVPQCLYSCSSITELDLRACSFKIETNVQWNQLKRLSISRPDGLSGDAMNQILLGAPRLEKLVFLCLRISENFNIRSTSLKILKMVFCTVKAEGELRIWGPNLLKLDISGRVSGSCLLYVPSLTTADLSYLKTRVDMSREKMLHQVFRSICYVENVTFPDWSFQFLVDMKKKDMLVQFPNAEFVKLGVSDCQMLDVLVVLDMFPKLKKLIVHPRFQNGCMPIKVESEMISGSPSLLHLKTVEIEYKSYPSISSLVKFVLENAHVLQKMVLQQFGEEYNEEAFILASKELLGMWRSSPYAEVIISPHILIS